MALPPASRIFQCLAFCAALAAPLQARAGEVTVFAAASLKNAIEEVARNYSAQSGHEVRLSLAASSALARQIQQGAPADVFISANSQWMEVLAAQGLVETGSRVDLLSNRLVLVAPAADAATVVIAPGLDLAALLDGGRLVMALADAVPAGIYAKAGLQWLGQWPAILPQTAQTGNVRIALALVARGEARFGIVYASDAQAEPAVAVAGLFPPESHPPILYPAAAVAGRANPLAAGFLTYLQSDTARAAFTGQGFVFLPDAP